MKRRLSFLFVAALVGCATTPEPEAVAEKVAEAPAPAPATQPDPTTVVPESEAWRASRPEPGEAPQIVVPKFEKATLKNGLTVLVSSRRDLPVVAMGVVVRAGSATEPQGKAGLADLTYELFLEGAGGKDAIALADAFADLGATPSVQTGPDGVEITTGVLTRNADAALGLLADVVQRPALAKADFDRKKKERLADLARLVGEPRYLAQEAFDATVFGESHPYGHPGMGTPRSVERLLLADAKAFFKKHVGPKATAVVFAGDVSLAEAKKWAEKHFGKWKGAATPMKAPAAPKTAQRTSVVLVPKPGLGQTVLYVGRPGLAAGHEDEWPLRLATAVYGGFFSSRLNMNLREDKGYTYGARAWLDPRLGAGPLAASSAVRADVTGPSLSEVFEEMKGLAKEPITEEELADALEGIKRSIPGWFETVEGLASAAGRLFTQAQPLDRYDRIVATLDGMTLATVHAAATKYYDPKVMQVVLVGDPDVVNAQVPALGLGTLVSREPAGAAPAPKEAGASSAK